MFKPGDHFVICDRSGEKVLRSECVKEWNGFIVKREYSESRHPLDFQKPPRAERAVKYTRPTNDIFLNPGDVTPNDL